MMNIESRLAIDLLADSRIDAHQRRYTAVQRYINVFGFLPSFEQITRDIPKKDSIVDQVSVNSDLAHYVNYYESLLDQNPGDKELICILDSLYDQEYRL